jgi:hypothetical protein
MEQSWELDSASADREITRHLRNQNVHYSVHKSQPLSRPKSEQYSP